MKKRLAIIGIGGIAQKGYLPILSNWPGIELMLQTRNEEKLLKVMQQYRIKKGTTQFNEVLEWEPDAVCIFTSTGSHYELVKKALEAMLDVFVEKPMTRSIDETRELAELADRNDCILMTAFNRRFSPVSQRIKKLCQDHNFTLAHFQKNRPKHISQDFGINNRDGVIHLVDLMRFLLGDGKVLSSTYRVDEQGSITESSTSISLDKGGIAIISSSLHAGKWLENGNLHGDTASIIFNQFRGYEYINKGERVTWEQPYDASWESNLIARGITGELQHFFDCIENRAQPLTNGWDSLKSQELIEEIIAKAVKI